MPIFISLGINGLIKLLVKKLIILLVCQQVLVKVIKLLDIKVSNLLLCNKLLIYIKSKLVNLYILFLLAFYLNLISGKNV